MDVTSGVYVPLSDNSQSPLSSPPPSPLLPPDGHYNGHPNGYFDEPNSDIDDLNDELNSNAIKAL